MSDATIVVSGLRKRFGPTVAPYRSLRRPLCHVGSLLDAAAAVEFHAATAPEGAR